MRILAINGSHRPGKGTAALLQAALDAAQGAGAETEFVELARLDIGYCIGCNACLAKPACTLSDDMDGLVAKMKAADGIIVGSPDYFANVAVRGRQNAGACARRAPYRLWNWYFSGLSFTSCLFFGFILPTPI